MRAQDTRDIASAEAASVVSDAVVRAAAELQLTNQVLGEVIGVSAAFVSQMRHGNKHLAHGKKPYQLAQLLLRVYRSLYPLAGGDLDSMRQWLRNENLDLERAVPLDLMVNPQGLIDVLDYLDGYRARI